MQELSSKSDPPRRAWLSILLILLVLVLGYGIAPNRLALVGEEACRAQHGIEMASTGDWIIPKNQGVPRLDRPPGQYWVLALIHTWVRPLSPLVLRMSMMAILLGTSLMIWWYARRFLSEAGAFVAAVAYPTMGHVFDVGRRAETDGQFAMMVFAALALWHYGYGSGWSRLATWTVSAAVAALATLTKGTQAPVAYFGTIWLFLALGRDWRWLVHRSNLAGLAVFFGIVAIWQVPLFFETGWPGTRSTWIDPGAGRFDAGILSFIKHLVKFPITAFASTLPWSVLLFGLLSRRFWQIDGRGRSAVQFMLLGAAMIFVPVWISAAGKPRYIMPMYPFLAVLVGAVVQQALAFEQTGGLRRFWRDYLRGFTIFFACGIVLFLLATILAPSLDDDLITTFVQPWPLMVLLLVVGAFALSIAYRNGSSNEPRIALRQAFTLAALVAIFFNGPVLNVIAFETKEVGPEVHALKRDLPDDVQLVSFGRAHIKFVYWYGETIPILERPRTREDVPDDVEFFAVTVWGHGPTYLPFDFEQIARISMDSRRLEPAYVVVGRRQVPAPTAPQR